MASKTNAAAQKIVKKRSEANLKAWKKLVADTRKALSGKGVPVKKKAAAKKKTAAKKKAAVKKKPAAKKKAAARKKAAPKAKAAATS